jgi:acetyl-CoA carboxylase carboxyltransferase component/biotin carboxyl carrier protein
VEDSLDLIYDGTKYRFTSSRSSATTMSLTCNGSCMSVEFRSLSDGGLLLKLAGRSHTIYAVEEAGGLRLVIDGATCIFSQEYDPTQLKASLSGKLARYLVEDGAHCAAGTAFAEVEVMKMYMPLTLPEAGTITLHKPEGSVLEPGELLATVVLDDPSKVSRATVYTGPLLFVSPSAASSASSASPPHGTAITAAPTPVAAAAAAGGVVSPVAGPQRKWHAVARSAQRVLSDALQGYLVPRHALEAAWRDRDAAFAAPDLPAGELEEQLAVLSSRLPGRVAAGLQRVLEAYRTAFKGAVEAAVGDMGEAAVAAGLVPAPAAAGEGAAAPAVAPPASASATLTALHSVAAAFLAPLPSLDVAEVAAVLDAHAAELPAKEAAAFATLVAPLRDLASKYAAGVAGAGRASLHALLSEFLAVERAFGGGRRTEDVVADLRAAAGTNKEALGRLFDTLRAHAQLKQRNGVVLACLARVAEEIEGAKELVARAQQAAAKAKAEAAAAATATAAGASGTATASSPEEPAGGVQHPQPVRRVSSGGTSTAHTAPSSNTVSPSEEAAAAAAGGSAGAEGALDQEAITTAAIRATGEAGPVPSGRLMPGQQYCGHAAMPMARSLPPGMEGSGLTAEERESEQEATAELERLGLLVPSPPPPGSAAMAAARKASVSGRSEPATSPHLQVRAGAGSASSAASAVSVGGWGGLDDAGGLEAAMSPPALGGGGGLEGADGASGTHCPPAARPPTQLPALLPLLHALAELRGVAYAELTLEARQLLVTYQQPSQQQRRSAITSLLRAVGPPELRAAGGQPDRASVAEDALTALVEDDQPLLHILSSFFHVEDPTLRRNAAEAYIRRLYRMYHISCLSVEDSVPQAQGAAPSASAACGPSPALDFLLVRWLFSSEHSTARSPTKQAAGPAQQRGKAGAAFALSPAAGASAAPLLQQQQQQPASSRSVSFSETGSVRSQSSGGSEGARSRRGTGVLKASAAVPAGGSRAAALHQLAGSGGLRRALGAGLQRAAGAGGGLMTYVESYVDLQRLADREEHAAAAAAAAGSPALLRGSSEGEDGRSVAGSEPRTPGVLGAEGVQRIPSDGTTGSELALLAEGEGEEGEEEGEATSDDAEDAETPGRASSHALSLSLLQGITLEQGAGSAEAPRHGALAAFASLSALLTHMPQLLALLQADPRSPAPAVLAAVSAAGEGEAAGDAAAAATPGGKPFVGASASPLPHVLHIALQRSPIHDMTALGPGGMPSSGSFGGPRLSRGRFDSSSALSVGSGESLVPADDESAERYVVECLTQALAPWAARLRAAGVRRLTFGIPTPRTSAGVVGAAAALPLATGVAAGASAKHHASAEIQHTPLRDAAQVLAAHALASAAVDLHHPAAATCVPAAIDAAAAAGPGVSIAPYRPSAQDLASFGPAVLAVVAAAAGSLSGHGSGPAGLGPGGHGAGSQYSDAFPWIYTFRSGLAYSEDSIVRHIEPPSSAHLELARLANFKVRQVPTPNRSVHVYAAEPRPELLSAAGSGAAAGGARLRYFVRAIVRQTTRLPTLGSVYEQYPGPERMFVECLDALSIAMGDALQDTASPVGNNHIFLNVLPVARVRPEYVEAVTKILARRYGERLRRLRVGQVEFRITVSADGGHSTIPLRLVSSNPTGYVLRVDTYVEARPAALLGPAGGSAAGAPPSPATAPVFMSVSLPPQGASAASAAAMLGLGGGGAGSYHNSLAGSWSAANNQGFAGDGAGFGLAGSTSFGGGFGGGYVSAHQSPSGIAGRFGPLGGASDGAAGGQPGGASPLVPASPATGQRGDWDGLPVTTPYPITSPFDRQRALAAALSDTVYVFDWPELFTRALDAEWGRYGQGRMPMRRPRTLLSAVELVLRRRQPGDGTASGAHIPGSTAPGVPGQAAPGGLAASQCLNAPPFAASSSPYLRPEEWELVPTHRAPGNNDCGMVAWLLTLYTPQYPEEAGGRQLVLIANDITFKAGSFGTAEDCLFKHASEYARVRGVPRVYIAANSGARIGLSEEVKRHFKVAWSDPRDPSKGHRYLYLTPADYRALAGQAALEALEAQAAAEAARAAEAGAGAADATGSSNSNLVAFPFSQLPAAAGGAGAGGSDAGASMPPVRVRRVLEGGEVRYQLTDIIGREPDLGVENLRGSGMIAGETSRAYAESFTLTYVTGRSVGIGAYLVRLGHRTIQKAGSAPILLTGYEALNKLMGSEVYTSNLQLGGPKIMFSNGVSQETVDNDYEGASSVLRWLSYVPRTKGAPQPITDCMRGDEPDRDVEWAPPPSGAPYDPRHALAGVMLPQGAAPAAASPAATAAVPSAASAAAGGAWVSGLFDRDSWREAMSGWARSVITGRARLGGIPVGVIAPEVRTTTAVVPADPAVPASTETVLQQAGQVWYPDSAFKTAQAIRDFAGEDLPILIVANWRGFSGGARDMFSEVLKYGSYIVDALISCKQPVLVYVPPGGELRGGAWVVVDPTINADVMEAYADPTARGGVLEPSGTVAIKFRNKELVALAHRVDPLLAKWDAELKALLAGGSGAAGAAATPSGASQSTVSSTGGSASAGARVSAREAISSLRLRIKGREEALMGACLQVATTFADLHDTPGRMAAMGAIHGVVPWRRARAFFYWRLRRRLAELAFIARLRRAAPSMSLADATALLQSWFAESASAPAAASGLHLQQLFTLPSAAAHGGSAGGGRSALASHLSALWRDDFKVLRWLADTRDALEARARSLRRDNIADTVLSLGMEDPSAVVSGVMALLARLPPDQREAALASLRRGVLLGAPSALSFASGGVAYY